jgi:hypothetical protein
MACCARVEGPVTVSTTPRRDTNVVVTIDFPYDAAVKRVVVLGNGMRLFGDAPRTPLELSRTRTFMNGNVLLRYRTASGRHSDGGA